jgi:ATP-binding cassette, subfamily C, bacterial
MSGVLGLYDHAAEVSGLSVDYSSCPYLFHYAATRLREGISSVIHLLNPFLGASNSAGFTVSFSRFLELLSIDPGLYAVGHMSANDSTQFRRLTGARQSFGHETSTMKFGKSFGTFVVLVRAYPKRTLIVAGFLLAAGLSEGIGIGGLLPLFKLILGGEQTSGENPLGRVIDNIFGHIGIQPTVGVLLSFIAVLMCFKGALILISTRQIGFTAARVETDLRLGLLRSLLNANWPYFISQPSGRLSNAITTEAVYASYCYELVCRMIAEMAQLVVYVGIALLVSWQMTLGALLAGGLSALALSAFMGMARSAGERQTNLLNSVSARLVDGLSGIKPLKAMACEDRVGPLLESEIRDLNKAKQKQVLSLGAVRALVEPLFVVLLAACAYLAFVIAHVQLEILIVLMIIFWRALLRSGALQSHYQELARYESAFQSLEQAINAARAAEETTTGARSPTLNHGVTFRDVSFSYGAKVLLRNASLTIQAGRVTAIVGPSGVGKTTVADLIVGLLRPQSGDISIDNIPITEIDLRQWRRMLGYTPQETILFHDSVLANVTLEDPALNRDDAEHALRLAGAWEFVSALPEGMDTIVGERGGKLSGGQRQRIALARALVRKPKMLILDEVTAGLDPQTEAEIVTTIRGLKGIVTILVISHQSELVGTADVIYELSEQQPHLLAAIGRTKTDRTSEAKQPL